MSGCSSPPRSSRIGDRAAPDAALRRSAATCLLSSPSRASWLARRMSLALRWVMSLRAAVRFLRYSAARLAAMISYRYSAAAWKSCLCGFGSHFTVCAMSRSRHSLPYVLGHLVQRDRHGGARGAPGELGGPGGQAALAHRDPERDAGQFGVAELDARPDLPVVHDDLDA